MIEKIADDLIGQMTEARLIDKEMEARYVYVFICWIEKFITVGSIIVISLMFHKLLPTIFFLVFFLELRKRTGGYHLDKFYRCYLASIVSYLVIVIISEKLSEYPQWLFAIVGVWKDGLLVRLLLVVLLVRWLVVLLLAKELKEKIQLLKKIGAIPLPAWDSVQAQRWVLS